MNEALGCITAQRLSVPPGGTIRSGPVYAIVLNRGVPVALRGMTPVRLFLGCRFRIVESLGPDGRFYAIDTVEYAYQFLTRAGQEFLSFHWNPEAASTTERAYPHLHIGSPMLAADAPVLPDRFNKLHIPTSPVSLEAVIRFAIEELGVDGRAGWQDILKRTRTAHEPQETRPS
jgi:hypothetical protein